MNREEKKTLKEFGEFCLTTCSRDRLNKINRIMLNSKSLINKDLTKLKVDDVVKFLSKINQSNYKPYTKNDYKKIFKRFLKWYYKDLELIEGNKVKEGFKCVSPKRAFNKNKINENTLIKPKELEKMMRSAKSLKWKALISFAYESGFRPCEIRQLKWKDLAFDDSLGICRVWTLSPKTKEDRKIPVKDCVVHLKRWREEYQFPNRRETDFVFPSQHLRDQAMGKGVITQMFRRICEKAKIRNIFPYLLRHSRIWELQKRLPEKIAAKFGGHSIETSEIYNHIGDSSVEESMLQKIYVTEELTEEQKNKYDKEIEQLKNTTISKKAFASFVKEILEEFSKNGLSLEDKNKLIASIKIK